MPKTKNAESKPKYFATINLYYQVYVQIPEATSFQDALDKVEEKLSATALWAGTIPVEDVWDHSLNLESITGPGKRFKDE